MGGAIRGCLCIYYGNNNSLSCHDVLSVIFDLINRLKPKKELYSLTS